MGYYKLTFLYNQLMKNDCDYLVFLDADAAVNNPNIKIEDIIDDKHELFLSRGNSKYDIIDSMSKLYQKIYQKMSNKKQTFEQPIETYFTDQERANAFNLFCINTYQNEGLYIIKNTNLMKDFYKDAIKHIDLFIDLDNTGYPVPEQMVLLFLLRKDKYKDCWTFLYPQAQTTILNSYEFAYDEDKTFIMHNYGPFDTQQKYQIMINLQENKHWKPIFEKENNMKIKLTSFCVDNDESYKKLYQNVKEYNSAYCKLHNYDYEFTYVTQNEIRKYFNNDFFIWDIFSYKIKFMYDQLMKNDCDYLVFLDADAVISKPHIKIESFIDNKHQLFLSRGNSRYDFINVIVNLRNKINNILNNQNILFQKFKEQLITEQELFPACLWLSVGYLDFNEGFTIIKNTDLMKEYFKKCIDELDVWLDTENRIICPDGMVMRILLETNKYKNIYTFMPVNAQGGTLCAFDSKYDEDKTFILHNYAAFSIEEKHNIIKQLKNNKWWKDILK